jgi:putative addiction module killer protein
MMLRIVEFVEGGRSSFADWFNELDGVVAARVDRQIRRLEAGNFGSVKPLREGVFEVIMDFGPGYRVYYGVDGKTIIILLGGGTKRKQQKDIDAAIERWRSYKRSESR